MVQVVRGRRGRYSQVKCKKEIVSVSEGSISSLGIISSDLTRSYSFIIPTAVSVPCPIFSPTYPKGTQAQCFYKVSLSTRSNHPPAQQLPHRAVSSKQKQIWNHSGAWEWTPGDTGAARALPTIATMVWAVAAGDIGKAQIKHAQSPWWLPVPLLMQMEAVGDLVLQLHIEHCTHASAHITGETGQQVLTPTQIFSLVCTCTQTPPQIM